MVDSVLVAVMPHRADGHTYCNGGRRWWWWRGWCWRRWRGRWRWRWCSTCRDNQRRTFFANTVTSRNGLAWTRWRGRETGAGVCALGQGVVVQDESRLACDQIDTADTGTHLDLVELGGHRQRAIRVIGQAVARATNADGSCAGGDFIVVAVALTDQASDGAHAPAHQIH